MNGCTVLGHLEKEQGNKNLARRLYKKACEGGEMDGCKHLKVLNRKSKKH